VHRSGATSLLEWLVKIKGTTAKVSRAWAQSRTRGAAAPAGRSPRLARWRATTPSEGARGEQRRPGRAAVRAGAHGLRYHNQIVKCNEM
jgi:hypothetical protein